MLAVAAVVIGFLGMNLTPSNVERQVLPVMLSASLAEPQKKSVTQGAGKINYLNIGNSFDKNYPMITLHRIGGTD